MNGWHDNAEKFLEEIEASGERRRIPELDGKGHRLVGPDGRSLISFASNDYLGLTQHPEVIQAAKDALDRWGAGAGSARLIVGARDIHRRLEAELALWKEKESAVLFPAGYMANVGLLTAVGREGVTIFSDALNHASIVDGCRLARAETRVYPHLDLEALDEGLGRVGKAVVVSDSVFSMDGDVADIEGLTDVCARHDALLILDEAHAVLGPEPEPTERVERIRVGTLSKFLGSSGGFIACDTVFADLIVNTARPFIFTTATPPADAAAALKALEILRGAEGERSKGELRERIDILAPGHPSPIIPIVIGDSDAAMKAAADLRHEGFLVPAIRPPSVAPGSARLRVTVSATHPLEDVERLARCLERFREVEESA